MIEFRKNLRIGVIGGANPDEKSYQLALRVGQLIAQNNAILICGGLRGIMEAAAQGAKKAGGVTVGILPGNSPDEANPYIDIAIATGMGYARNSLVALNSDVIIAVDGQYGTLTEIAYGFIYGKRVIGLGTWDVKGITHANTAEEAVRLAIR
ncbi:MAG: TIGR00725 family protein [Candidatus Aminicenantales bacterium]